MLVTTERAGLYRQAVRYEDLDEAAAAVRTYLCDFCDATGPDDPAVVATLDLTESGGTIRAPGVVIKVSP